MKSILVDFKDPKPATFRCFEFLQFSGAAAALLSMLEIKQSRFEIKQSMLDIKLSMFDIKAIRAENLSYGMKSGIVSLTD